MSAVLWQTCIQRLENLETRVDFDPWRGFGHLVGMARGLRWSGTVDCESTWALMVPEKKKMSLFGLTAMLDKGTWENSVVPICLGWLELELPASPLRKALV